MKFLAFITAASGLALAPTPAVAADWWIMEITGGKIHFIDMSTLVITGKKRTAWSHLEMVNGRQAFKYLMARVEYDCVERSLRATLTNHYNGSDEEIRTIPAVADATYVAPGSPDAAHVEFVCSFDPANPVEPASGVPDRMAPDSTPRQFIADIEKARAELRKRR
jgi:hypothetical protein